MGLVRRGWSEAPVRDRADGSFGFGCQECKGLGTVQEKLGRVRGPHWERLLPAVSGNGMSHRPASVSVLSSAGTTEQHKKRKHKKAGGILEIGPLRSIT